MCIRDSIKNLNTTINSQIEMITSLKQQTAQQAPVAATTVVAEDPAASPNGRGEPVV